MTTRNIPLSPTLGTGKHDDAIAIGQVGLAGGVGYAHINEVEKNPHFRLVAGHDRHPADPHVAGAITRLAGSKVKICPTFEEMLADPEIEAIDICTPHHFHRAMAVAALDAGKHVLVEKPMATHPSDIEAMLAAQKRSGKVAAVQMQHVGRSSMLALREAIQGGALGKIKEVFLASLWWRTEEYYGRIPWAGRMKVDGSWCIDGALYNQCIHYINQMLTLVSPGPLPSVAQVKNVRCGMYKFHDAAALEAGDTAFVRGTLDTAHAPALTFVGSTCSRQERHSIEILGEKGRALWNGAGYLFVQGEPVAEFHDDRSEFDGRSRVFESFAAAIRKGTTPITDFREIQKVTGFINDCYESGGWNITKAPWAATETLFSDVIQAVYRERKLPAELKSRPDWA